MDAECLNRVRPGSQRFPQTWSGMWRRADIKARNVCLPHESGREKRRRGTTAVSQKRTYERVSEILNPLNRGVRLPDENAFLRP